MLFDFEPPSAKEGLTGLVIGGIITGIFGIAQAIIRYVNAHKQRVADRETSVRETGVEHSKDLTNRMETLMSAYETHIRDLGNDLADQKTENRELRTEIERLKGASPRLWGETGG